MNERIGIIAPDSSAKPVPSKEDFGKILVELGEHNERVVVCEADLMRASGTRPFLERFPERHFQFGVAEQNTMAAAAGLALSGKTVFASTFANFASKRACDQVSISIAYNMANVKICGIYAGLTSEKNGGTHISVEDISIMRSIPNMRVVEPADTAELAEITKAVAEYEGPVYFRQPKMFLRNIFNNNYRFTFGKAVEITEGDDITIIACGIMTGVALDAVKELENRGIRARLINMSTIKPLDEEIVIKAAEETKAILTVENHTIIGGLGGAVAEVLAERRINSSFLRLGIMDTFGQTATLDWLLEKNGLSKQHIVNSAIDLIHKKED